MWFCRLGGGNPALWRRGDWSTFVPEILQYPSNSEVNEKYRRPSWTIDFPVNCRVFRSHWMFIFGSSRTHKTRWCQKMISHSNWSRLTYSLSAARHHPYLVETVMASRKEGRHLFGHRHAPCRPLERARAQVEDRSTTAIWTRLGRLLPHRKITPTALRAVLRLQDELSGISETASASLAAYNEPCVTTHSVRSFPTPSWPGILGFHVTRLLRGRAPPATLPPSVLELFACGCLDASTSTQPLAFKVGSPIARQSSKGPRRELP